MRFPVCPPERNGSLPPDTCRKVQSAGFDFGMVRHRLHLLAGLFQPGIDLQHLKRIGVAALRGPPEPESGFPQIVA